jgi:cobalt-zinc-cadmium efflux system membrane fusion protein
MKAVILGARTASWAAAACLSSACAPDATAPGDTKESGAGETRFLELSAEMLDKARLEYAAAAPGELRERIQSYGEIVVDRTAVAPILSRIRGVVVKVHKHVGDVAQEGDLLVEIESDALATAIIDYLNSEHDLEFAREALERERQLFEQKLSSAETFNAKQQALRKAEIAHAAALQPLNLLHFSEETLHAYADAPEDSDLTRLEIRSPLAGAITRCSVHQGESVEADTEIMRVTDLSSVWVEFRVPLEASFRLQIGESVPVRSSATGDVASASVQYLSPIAEKASRTVVVRATLDNREGGWRPGTPVVVDVVVSARPVAVGVPAAAVLDHAGGHLVFVRAGERRFEARTISVGERDEEGFEVLHGLAAGEEVVTTNAYLLKAEWLIQAE